MNYQILLKENSLTGYPVGLSGCRTGNNFYDSCDYDISVFDDKIQNDEIIQFENNFIKIHHGSLSETNSKKLLQYDNMKILQDDSWDLRMFLSKIKEKRLTLFRDHAKNSFIQSLFCCEKTKTAIKESNAFAACWKKCASYFLAEGILAINNCMPGPSHMLETLRQFEKNSINEKISIINDTVGIERSTPSLLERMVKSTIGFSDVVEKNFHSLLIEKKYHYFLENSMLSDCYFYLGYINKQNFVDFKELIENQPELIHILKVSFDVEADLNLLEQQSKMVQKSANDILESISR